MKAGKLDVHLEPGYPVKLILTQDFSMSSKWESTVVLQQYLNPGAMASAFETPNDGMYYMPTPGTFEVSASFNLKDDFNTMPIMGVKTDPATIELRANRKIQTFKVTILPNKTTLERIAQ